MATLTITANPPDIATFGETILTLRAREASGAAVAAGRVISLTTTLGVLLDPAPQTDSLGVATTRLRGDGRSGVARVAALLNGSEARASLDLPVGQGVQVDVRAQPAAVPRRGTSALTIRAARGDGSSFPAGTRVTLTTNIGSVVPADVALDGLGVAAATFTAASAVGTAEIVASIPGSGEGRVFVVVGGEPTISLSAAPSSIAANGRSELLAFVADPAGAPVVGAEVQLSTTLGRIEGSQPRTDNTGLVRSLLVGDGTRGQARVTARVTGTAAADEVVVRLGDGVRLSLSANPGTITSNGESLLGVAVVGPDGAAVANAAVDLSTNAGTLSATTVSTSTLGVAQSTLRANGFSGVARVTATLRGTTTSDSVDVIVQ